MRLAIGADHAGSGLKEELAAYLRAQGHDVTDFGTNSPESVDYVDFVVPLARAVAAGEFERGIFCCGTGIGPAIAANKVPGVRSASVREEWSARQAVAHTDVNVLTLGERVTGLELAKAILDAFLAATPEGGRHERRREKIAALDRERTGASGSEATAELRPDITRATVGAGGRDGAR